MHQLVVMGNGFDKSCGLQSGFSDFFRSRHDKKDAFCDSWDELSNTQTLWDVVLEAKKERSSTLWCDDEAAIHQALIPSLRNNGFSQIEQSFRKLNSTGLVLEADRLYDFLRSQHLSFTTTGVAYGYALDQLHVFERELEQYLVSEVQRAELGYYQAAVKKMGAIIGDAAGDYANGRARNNAKGLFANIETSILSFNYTSVLGDGDREELGVVSFINAHGELGHHNIVIGIDAGQIEGHQHAIPFTKTYRLLALKSLKENCLLRPADRCDKENSTAMIKFLVIRFPRRITHILKRYSMQLIYMKAR